MIPAEEQAFNRAIYRRKYNVNYDQLSQEMTCRLISQWLKKYGFDRSFRQDIRCLLQENRRTTRRSNRARYGDIPFWRNAYGQVFYKWSDIHYFLNEKLLPICVELERRRMVEATKAGLH